MDRKRQKLIPGKTKKKLKLSTPVTTSQPSNIHFICNKEVVIQLERLSDSVVAEMTGGGSALPLEQTKKKLKLSSPKTKLHPSNPHFICDKEVVIQLERLNDSFVAEMTASGSALPLEQDNESNDDALDINSLPNEIILEVFGYLEQNQLGQIARVCRRWNVLTKSPVLWKNVNVKFFFASDRSQTAKVKSFIDRLPSCVISISLNFTKYRNSIRPLHFAALCLRLQEKCPHLEELILINSVLSINLSSVIDICTQFIPKVKNLIFHYSEFRCDCSTDECFGISKIKILELFNCHFNYFSSYDSPFSKVPHLNQLHLYGTDVDDSWFEDDAAFLNQLQVLNLGDTLIDHRIFQAIQNHGHNLKEFYVCDGFLQDHEITLNNSVFPHLKTICLADTYVTCEGVVSLIQSCPSLENVYVDRDVAKSFKAHPFVVANRCKSGIVKAINPIHDHNVDYLHN